MVQYGRLGLASQGVPSDGELRHTKRREQITEKSEAEGMFWSRVATTTHHSQGKAIREKELKRNRDPKYRREHRGCGGNEAAEEGS